MSLLSYESAFSQLNLHVAGAHRSPHKVAMLLAVTDLIEDGTLSENRIEYSGSLTQAFAARFKELRAEGDSSRPIYPYFHLSTEGFWHHYLKPGQSVPYRQLSTVTSRSQIDRHIAYAYLDDELFELLGNHTVRELLRGALLENVTMSDDERRARLQVNGWDWLECEACVQDYFDMLGKELRNEPYNKTAHRNASHSYASAARAQVPGAPCQLHAARGREPAPWRIRRAVRSGFRAIPPEAGRPFRSGDRGGMEQPFYISENEVEFSREFNDRYSLYRVYDFCSRGRRLYQMSGCVENHVSLNPVLYRAGFG